MATVYVKYNPVTFMDDDDMIGDIHEYAPRRHNETTDYTMCGIKLTSGHGCISSPSYSSKRVCEKCFPHG